MRYRHGPMFLQLIFQLLQESLQRPPNHVTKFFQRLECVRGRLCPHLSRSAARSHKQSPRPVTKPSPLLRSLRIQRKAPGKPAAEPSDTPQPATDPDPATPCPGRKDPFILPIRIKLLDSLLDVFRQLLGIPVWHRLVGDGVLGDKKDIFCARWGGIPRLTWTRTAPLSFFLFAHNRSHHSYRMRSSQLWPLFLFTYQWLMTPR